MPSYLVEGADRESGEDRAVSITADSADDAQSVAAARGMLVSRIAEVRAKDDPAESDDGPLADSSVRAVTLIGWVYVVIAGLIAAGVLLNIWMDGGVDLMIGLTMVSSALGSVTIGAVLIMLARHCGRR